MLLLSPPLKPDRTRTGVLLPLLTTLLHSTHHVQDTRRAVRLLRSRRRTVLLLDANFFLPIIVCVIASFKVLPPERLHTVDSQTHIHTYTCCTCFTLQENTYSVTCHDRRCPPQRRDGAASLFGVFLCIWI